MKMFIDECKLLVADKSNSLLEDGVGESICSDEVYVVWSCKTLQNAKALLSTTKSDGMYYELTYNGTNKEIYLDSYKKIDNKCIKVEIEF